ncbi:M48 family metallopeptidase [Zoogloea sp.]|uniref:M48 metallopeptidase family protein n=1 Tax=Zoogloea sp. TaxID=49181 RepID=UPI00261E5337|nr:M48 family metallopeptidase [Zoogloea sp.]MDD3352383.1 M48 family metallopeptidase [Zoogloea sp.]
MSSPQSLKYLLGYPEPLLEQVRGLLAEGTLGPLLLAKYPLAHRVRNDTALYDYVAELKARHLRNGPPVSKVAYDGKLQSLHKALGTHTRVARVQGGRLKTRREIRIATLFREAPEAFLRMIVAHELAHLREPDHDKAFYQLCCRMEPDYHQLEFDVRTWLTWMEAKGDPLWGAVAPG